MQVLGKYFAKFVAPRGNSRELLDDFAGFFHSFFLGGEEFEDYCTRVRCWLGVVGGAESDLQAHYQTYYLQQHVPLNFRWRVAQDTSLAGQFLPGVRESISKPTEGVAVDAGALAPAGLFQITGLRGGAETSGVVKRLLALAPVIVATLGAAFVSGVFKLQLRNNVSVVLFIPAIFALAEGIALQAVTLRLGSRRGGSTPKELLHAALEELRTGIYIGAVCAVLGAGVAFFEGFSFDAILPLSGALAATVPGAAVIGHATPGLLARFGLDKKLAAGTTASAASGLLAVIGYLLIVCKFFG
jgi:hypothetical protein